MPRSQIRCKHRRTVVRLKLQFWSFKAKKQNKKQIHYQYLVTDLSRNGLSFFFTKANPELSAQTSEHSSHLANEHLRTVSCSN